MSQILDDFLCVLCFSSPRLASGIHSKRPKNANYNLYSGLHLHEGNQQEASREEVSKHAFMMQVYI